MLIREMTDDDSSEFVASQWGSSYYKTDGSSIESLTRHYAGQPKTLMDGGTDNAMCSSASGQDLEICGSVRLQNFTSTMMQSADMKYSENCNGHGICDLSVGVCHCQAGWSGFNCSEPEKPCGGVVKLTKSFGSFSDGYGVGREYEHNINCTWIIEPEHHDTYGLPMVFTFVFLDMEAGFDAVELYEEPVVDINFKLRAMGVGGTFPKDRWAMPHSIVVGNGKTVAINFATDAANPSGVFYGFKVLFGRLDSTYIKALSYPLLSPGCNRKLGEGNPKCLDDMCTNCGVTLDEDTDDAAFMGLPENMCFSSFQSSNTTHYNVSQDYYMCQKVLQDTWLQFTAGTRITMSTPCRRGLMKIPAGFEYDRPEYVLGSGPPEAKGPTLQEGQAWQRGYIPMDWWEECTFQCNANRKSERYNSIFEDLPGKAGPIFVAQLTARESSRASKLKGAYVTRPPSRVTGLQYGHESIKDNRTQIEKNSMILRDLYNPTFKRFTTTSKVVEVELGKEYCEFAFTPTMPGIYQANFFEMRKDRYFGDYAEPVPFPPGMEHRTVVVMPGRTSPGHSKAFGPGLAYYQTTRTGIGVPFRIDSYDQYDNLRLVGGDTFVVALVHEHMDGQTYAQVSNNGNGSYYVVYNVTLSGRYTVSITLPSLPQLCDKPRRVLLSPPNAKGQVRQMTGLRCDLGTDFTVMKNQSDGSVRWCTPVGTAAAKAAGEENCVEYSYQQAAALPRQNFIPFGSPFSVWVDSGPITTSSVKAFGTGLSVAIATYPAFFMLRIRDVFGNWASSLENITTGFEMPRISQNMFHDSTTPTSSMAMFAGDEVFQGDYASEWQPFIAGHHRISIMLCNPFCIHIQGSPYMARVHPAPTYGPNSTANGNGIMDGFAGHTRTFEIQDRDSALNRRNVGGEDFAVSLSGLSLSDCPIIQDKVLLDLSRKCPHVYKSTITPCNRAATQYMSGPAISMNILPELSCMYMRNTADCRQGCCPNGTADACSEFDHRITRSGKSPRSTGCAVRQCGFPSDCKFAMKRMLQHRQLINQEDLLQSFLNNAHYRCPQIERLGLEAKMLLPPDVRKDGQFNLMIPSLQPDRPIWRGPMSNVEIDMWISENDLAFLYYDQTKNALGQPYFVAYGNATGKKDKIEGFVLEEASVQKS